MWFPKDDIFRTCDLYPVGIERPPGTTASSSRTAHRLLYIHHKDDKTPNIQKRQKCPEFRLYLHRAYKPLSCIQKSQIRAEKGQKRQMTTLFPYACARKTLPSPQKTFQNTAKHRATYKNPQQKKFFRKIYTKR